MPTHRQRRLQNLEPITAPDQTVCRPRPRRLAELPRRVVGKTGGAPRSRARGMSRSHRCRGRSLRIPTRLRSHGVGRHPRQPRRRHAQPGRIEGSVVVPGERSRAAPALAAQAPIERRPFAARTLGLVATEHAGQLRCRRGRSYRDWPRRGAAARLARKISTPPIARTGSPPRRGVSDLW